MYLVAANRSENFGIEKEREKRINICLRRMFRLDKDLTA